MVSGHVLEQVVFSNSQDHHEEFRRLFILAIHPDGMLVEDYLRLKVVVSVEELEMTITELLDSDADESAVVKVAAVYSGDGFSFASHGD
ncbi:hypothetical protein DFJ58DRAFT_741072, partial [Suillus subalutaceus]|uniref:uncharacterized protein n=1 Tax=Suillus subalutaceus TaxID=48586 RepID=UPI001B8722DC